jgi:hypothetical protein
VTYKGKIVGEKLEKNYSLKEAGCPLIKTRSAMKVKADGWQLSFSL